MTAMMCVRDFFVGFEVLRRLRASSRSKVTLALSSGSGLGGNRKRVKTGIRMEVRTGFRVRVGTVELGIVY